MSYPLNKPDKISTMKMLVGVVLFFMGLWYGDNQAASYLMPIGAGLTCYVFGHGIGQAELTEDLHEHFTFERKV